MAEPDLAAVELRFLVSYPDRFSLLQPSKSLKWGLFKIKYLISVVET